MLHSVIYYSLWLQDAVWRTGVFCPDTVSGYMEYLTRYGWMLFIFFIYAQENVNNDIRGICYWYMPPSQTPNWDFITKSPLTGDLPLYTTWDMSLWHGKLVTFIFHLQVYVFSWDSSPSHHRLSPTSDAFVGYAVLTIFISSLQDLYYWYEGPHPGEHHVGRLWDFAL